MSGASRQTYQISPPKTGGIDRSIQQCLLSELSRIAVKDLFEEIASLDNSLPVVYQASRHSHSSAALSGPQREVLKTIRESTERLGRPPSRREIGKAVGLRSMSSVSEELSVLERMGYLRRDTVDEIMGQESVSLPFGGPDRRWRPCASPRGPRGPRGRHATAQTNCGEGNFSCSESQAIR